MESLQQELVFLNLEGLNFDDETLIKDALSTGSEVIIFPWESGNEPPEKVPFASATIHDAQGANRESAIDDQSVYYESGNEYVSELGSSAANGAAYTFGAPTEPYPTGNVASVPQIHPHYTNHIIYPHVGLAPAYHPSLPMVTGQPNVYVTNIGTTLNMPGLTTFSPHSRPVNTTVSSEKYFKRMNHSPNKRGKGNFIHAINGHLQDQYSSSGMQAYVPNVQYPGPQSYGTTFYTGHPTVQSATGIPYIMQTPYAGYSSSANRIIYSAVASTASHYSTPAVTGQTNFPISTSRSNDRPQDIEFAAVNEAKPDQETEVVPEPEIRENIQESTLAVEEPPPSAALEQEAAISEEKPQMDDKPETLVTEEPTAVTEGNQPQQKTWASLFKSGASAAAANKLGTRVESQVPVDESPKVSAENTFPESTNAHVDPWTLELARHLSVYNLVHSSVALLPRGLTNKNNWCYINASLQALLACPPFVHLIKSLTTWAGHRLAESNTPIMDGMVEFISQFETIPIRSRKDRAAAKKEEFVFGSCFEPSSILRMLSNIRSETFKVEGRQEDAEEFLSCLLNGLHDEMVEVLKVVPAAGAAATAVAAAPNGDLVNSLNGDDEWQLIGPKNRSCVTRSAIFNKTPISDLFLGQMRSALYQAGSQTTATLQPFFSLQLDIQSERVQSVREALEQLVAKEPLMGYVCSKTGQEVEALRQTTLEELPPVLLLHLKCFVYDKSGGCQKLLKWIEFSADLELGKELLSPNQKSKVKERQRHYKLFAVVYHDGKEATKGHYVTEVLHTGLKTWLRFDDSIIKPIPDGSLFKYNLPRMPYLLFYRRADTFSAPAAAAAAAAAVRSAASTSPAVSSGRGARN